MFESLLEYFHPEAFFIALCVGLLYTYLGTTTKVVFKYPTPLNAGKITYKDNADVCYRYKASETTCPLDKEEITSMTFQ